MRYHSTYSFQHELWNVSSQTLTLLRQWKSSVTIKFIMGSTDWHHVGLVDLAFQFGVWHLTIDLSWRSAVSVCWARKRDDRLLSHHPFFQARSAVPGQNVDACRRTGLRPRATEASPGPLEDTGADFELLGSMRPLHHEILV